MKLIIKCTVMFPNFRYNIYSEIYKQREIFKRKSQNTKTMDVNLLLIHSFSTKLVLKCLEMFLYFRYNTWESTTKSVKKNSLFSTPFFVNEDGLKMIGNVTRCHYKISFSKIFRVPINLQNTISKSLKENLLSIHSIQ